MALFGNSLSALMDQRTQWLAKRSELLSHNLASADLPYPVRKDLIDFKDIIKKQNARKLDRDDPMLVDPLFIKDYHVIERRDEITRDLETLEMSQNALEHEFMINIMKKFHQMVRAVSTKPQG